jgi:hypothetical protein
MSRVAADVADDECSLGDVLEIEVVELERGFHLPILSKKAAS